MTVTNTLTTKRPKFQEVIKHETVQSNIASTLGSISKAKTFTASIISAVATNSDLAKCDAITIINAALLGESLNLSPSAQLGHFYMVPFNNKSKPYPEAQFILGYKGYIQLAIRSGQYKRINVLGIKEGELVNYDPLNEEINVILVEDEEAREQATTIGYYAMFELTNGFRKSMYWSKTKMEAHALKYSSGYRAKKGYTFWEKDFDGMAYKTMLRQLLSKWGIMSIEMTKAYAADMSVIEEDGSYNYVDNEPDPAPKKVTNQLAPKEILVQQEKKEEIPPADDFEAMFFEGANW